MGERVNSQKSFKCSFVACEATFNKSWKLEAHLCKHTGLKPFSCEQCEKSFCTRYQLARHNLSHSGEKPYKCQAQGCPEVFVTHASVKNHMTRIHLHQKISYVCDYEGCGKDFIKRRLLNVHKCEHTGVLPFRCTNEGCTKEFSCSGKLTRHEKRHKGYPCGEESCSFNGTTWTEYQKHRKQHRVKLQCDACRKLFLDTWFLKQHQLHVHSGEKRLIKCPKEGCGKTFPKPFNLQSHVLSEHEGKKAFSCAYPNCGKCFAMKESLWRHGVVHDPAKRKIQKLHCKKNGHKKNCVSESGTESSKEETRLATRLRNTSL